MTAYYNENDPKAAAWLRELIAANVIAPGTVDERDIRDVTVADLAGYQQCHFFAGIGGWSHALRLAGWPDSRPVWTGSCPCQPFSAAGKREGIADERHLWPAFFHLIEHARPAVLFGEQVASPAGLIWVRSVQTDLETAGYSIGIADLPAACVGAPHIRQRLFWMAEPVSQRCQGVELHVQPGQSRFDQPEVGRRGAVDIALGDAGSPRLSQRVSNGCVQRETVGLLPWQTALRPSDSIHLDFSAGGGCERFWPESTHGESVQTGADLDRLADADFVASGQGCAFDGGRDRGGDEEPRPGSGSGELPGRLGNAGFHGDRQHARELSSHEAEHEVRPEDCGHASVTAGAVGSLAQPESQQSHGGGDSRGGRGEPADGSGLLNMADSHCGGLQGLESVEPTPRGRRSADESVAGGFWDDCIWIACTDGKARPAQPGIFPLAARLSGSVGRVCDPSAPFDPDDTPEARTMRLRGYGNSIVPQVAAEFIGAYLDITGD